MLEMHVDGFRFDLASTLARELWEVDHLSSFFEVIQQDPVISQREIDRRTLGPGEWRLSGGEFSRPLGRVELLSTEIQSASSGVVTKVRSLRWLID